MISSANSVQLTPPHLWREVPFWSLFRRVKEINHPDEELLSVYRDHGVVPTASRDDNFNKPSLDLSGYQLVRKGALVTNKMKAWQGSIAISRHRGIVSPAYYVYEPLSREHDQYLHYLLRSQPFVALYQRISKGVRVNQWDLEHESLRIVPIRLPDLPTQNAIANFLNRETARIDQLIEKKQRMVSLLSSRWESLFHFGRRDASTEHIRFKFIATRSQRQIRLDGGDEFTPLGLYNRGRGYFKKDITPSQELGDSTFFLVREGDLILSGQFAWEGAVALADEDANGCVVSHRYPVYVGTRGVLTAYLYAYFRTADGQFMLDNCSSRYFPDNLQACGNHTLVAWSREQNVLRRHPMT